MRHEGVSLACILALSLSSFVHGGINPKICLPGVSQPGNSELVQIHCILALHSGAEKV